MINSTSQETKLKIIEQLIILNDDSVFSQIEELISKAMHRPAYKKLSKQELENSKAEIIFENGKFKEISIKDVQGKKPLDAQNLKKFKKIVELYRDDIIRKWIDFFVYNIEFPSEKITKKI